jgi:hypothetical protein
MRKLILLTLLVLIPTSSCYANLSLASNEAPQISVEQPTPQTTPVRPDATIKHPATVKHSTAIKHPTISRPRQVVHRWEQKLPIQGSSYEPSHEHCF